MQDFVQTALLRHMILQLLPRKPSKKAKKTNEIAFASTILAQKF
jgi:hypothetical protein